jgi:predicted secreted protein
MIVLTFGLFASGSAEPLAMKTEADSGHRVALRIGQELILTLNSNPSTGYRWMRTDTETSVLVTLGKPVPTGWAIAGSQRHGVVETPGGAEWCADAQTRIPAPMGEEYPIGRHHDPPRDHSLKIRTKVE